MQGTSVWDAADPGQALLAETDNPTRVFLLSSAITSRSDIGARQGPFGSVLKNARIAQRSRPDESLSKPPLEDRQRAGCSPKRPSRPNRAHCKCDRQRSDAGQSDAAAIRQRRRRAGQPSADNCRPMPTASGTPRDSEHRTIVRRPLLGQRHAQTISRPRRLTTTERRRRSRLRRPGATRIVSGVLAFEDEDVIRSAEQFTTMLNRLGRQGGTLRFAAGADLDLPSIVIEGSGRFQFVASPGVKAAAPAVPRGSTTCSARRRTGP